MFLKLKENIMVICRVCGKKFKAITHTHLKKSHGIDGVEQYKEIYGQYAPLEGNEKPKQEVVLEQIVEPVIEEPVIEEPKIKINSIADALGRMQSN